MEICEYDLAADDRIILTGSRMLLRRAESSPFYVIRNPAENSRLQAGDECRNIVETSNFLC